MRAQWWGHSTVRLDLGGVRILTDPVLTASLAHLHRRAGDLPPPDAVDVDAVLVSHLHADHFHVPSLQRLDPGVRLLVPRDGAAVLRDAGARSLAARCEEVVPGADLTLTGAGTANGSGRPDTGGMVTVHTWPAAHDGRRSPWSRRRGPALEFVLTAGAGTGAGAGKDPGMTVWFPGDTGLHDDLASVGPVDLGLVPVGGWGPSLGPGHLDPSRAAIATRLVQARHAVPIHYGTFWPRGLSRVRPHLFAAPGAEYAQRCAAESPDTVVHVLAHGEACTLDP